MANNDTIKHLNINSVPYDLRDDSAVNLTGNQSIDGVKTFTSRPVFNASQFATLADLGNGTLTIQGNGAAASTFTANQSGNTTLNIKSGSGITVSKSAANEITITNSGGVKYGDTLMENNLFGGRRLYINTLYNAFANADKKYYVTITKHKRSDNGITYPYIDETKAVTDDNYFVDGPITATLTSSAHTIFNGSYEDGLTLENTGATYLKIRIMFGSNTSPSGTSTYWTGYPYGTWYLSFYYNNTPNIVSQARVYNKYAAHTVGWHVYNASWWSGSASGTNVIHSITDEGDYQRSCVEFIIYGNDTSGRTITLTQIDYKLSRPDLARNGSTLTTFGPMSLYENFTWYYNHTQTLQITAATGALTTTGDITAAKFLTSSDAVAIANGHQLVIYNANGFRKTTTTFDGTTTTKYLSQKGTFESLPSATAYTLAAGTTANIVQLKGDGSVISTVTVNNVANATEADTLDGQHGSYYLDWDNLTDVPTNFVYTDTTQTISGAKTFSTTPMVTDGSSHIAITYKADANHFTYYKDDSIVKRTISGSTPSDVTLTFPSTGGTLATVDQIKNGTLTLKAGSNTQTFTANQSSNTTFEVTAADLGLSQAMSFIGVSTTDPTSSSGATVSGHTTWSKGEIVIYKRSGKSGYEEYIATANDNAHWELLGDADSYALKTISITGTGALGGGGTLAENRTITHNAGSAANKTSGWYKFSTDAYSHIASTTAVSSTDIFGFLNNGGNVTFTNDTTNNKISASVTIPVTDVQTKTSTSGSYASVVTNNIAKIDLSGYALSSSIGTGDLNIVIDETTTTFNANSSSNVTVNIHQPAVKRYI